MKIRTQHVSNSSTSSFVGWGWLFSDVVVEDANKFIDVIKNSIKTSEHREEYKQQLIDTFSKIEIENGQTVDSIKEDDYSVLEFIGITYQYLPEEFDMGGGGFVSEPEYEQSAKDMCKALENELQAKGLGVLCRPSYFQEAYHD